MWARCFGKDRGEFGSAEHRQKRWAVQRIVFASLDSALAANLNVALDATIHESPPEAYREYAEFFDRRGVPWAIRVLHPSIEVAIARDAARSSRPLGPARVASLRAKFTARVFPADWFLDTSADTPEETLGRLLHPVTSDERP